MTAADLDEQLIADLGLCARDPLRCAHYSFPWDEGELTGSRGPRRWQAEVLGAIGEHLAGPERYTPCQIAVSSGHGIGKSALVGMLLHWALSTHEDTKIVVTANTGTQLDTKTVPEVTKWFSLAINAHWWQVKATSITARSQGHEKLWRADFIPWSENNTQAFAGLHNLRKRVVVVFDEASEISDKIWEVAEGALTDEETEIIWLAFGNPTVNSGRFRECFGRYAHRWKRYQIDSRTVEGTNKTQIEKWIEDYGEDHDFVRVRVRGEFPRSGSGQFISSEDVGKCRRYRAEGYAGMPKILSVDVARFGEDQTIIGMRQGRKAAILEKHRGLDTVQVAERTIRVIDAQQPDAWVVDGDGLGAGVVDQLRFRGYGAKLFEFRGGMAPLDRAQYFNKRAEAWGLMRDALHAGMEIPDDPELDQDLTGIKYGFSNKSQITLEKKEDMKKRGLASPDCGDMLAMTFGVQIAPPKRKPDRPRPPAALSPWS